MTLTATEKDQLADIESLRDALVSQLKHLQHLKAHPEIITTRIERELKFAANHERWAARESVDPEVRELLLLKKYLELDGAA
jgi:hypothetical protein